MFAYRKPDSSQDWIRQAKGRNCGVGKYDFSCITDVVVLVALRVSGGRGPCLPLQPCAITEEIGLAARRVVGILQKIQDFAITVWKGCDNYMLASPIGARSGISAETFSRSFTFNDWVEGIIPVSPFQKPLQGFPGKELPGIRVCDHLDSLAG